MTQHTQGYQIPSTFEMIKTIKHNQPQMRMTHETEFNRITRIIDSGKALDRPYKNYLEMLYIEYILNKPQSTQIKEIKHSHIGMKMFQALT